jgi:hypothetical protein
MCSVRRFAETTEEAIRIALNKRASLDVRWIAADLGVGVGTVVRVLKGAKRRADGRPMTGTTFARPFRRRRT